MKETGILRASCLDVMEAALAAYDESDVRAWFDEVQRNGLKEHGFPRLCADMGILICRGRAEGMKELFRDMMTFCCREVSVRQRVANDFSVKELAFALRECQASGLFDPDELSAWRESLAAFDPWRGYDCLAPSDTAEVGNWVCYNMASEFMRGFLGLCDPTDFLRRQMPSQLRRFDQNGMYRDPHEPMLYDLASRCQFAVMLHFGYDGVYAAQMDGLLRQAGLATLYMQSVTGEIAFGGRSNQFLFNEAYLCALAAFEAARYRRLGERETAAVFDTAAFRALDAILAWAVEDPATGRKRFASHVRNCRSPESGMGCEGYAYFNKYMISLASFIYLALLFSDGHEEENAVNAPIRGLPPVWRTSEHFHKTFARAGGYFLEFDTNADPHYDANGLGRIHKAGVPSALGLSTPIPASPAYRIPSPNPGALAYGEGLTLDDGSGAFVFDEGARVSLTGESAEAGNVSFISRTILRDGEEVCASYTLSEEGLTVRVTGPGTVRFALPVFVSDGREQTVLTREGERLTVTYRGASAHFSVDGTLADTGLVYANRNGIYRRFEALREGSLTVKISLHAAGESPECTEIPQNVK